MTEIQIILLYLLNARRSRLTAAIAAARNRDIDVQRKMFDYVRYNIHFVSFKMAIHFFL